MSNISDKIFENPHTIKGMEVFFMSFDPKAMGRLIKRLRKRKKMTQEVFSGFADVGRSHLSALEHGHIAAVETYDKIAKAFEIPLSELFRLAEEEIKNSNS